MNNTGIFLTKPGVALPVVTEMTKTNWDAYASNLSIGILAGGSQVVQAFEAFIFRARANIAGGSPKLTINNRTNYVAQFITGAGSIDPSDGEILGTTFPLWVQEFNKVFLTGAKVKYENSAEAHGPQVGIYSPDITSFLEAAIQANTVVFVKSGTPTDSDSIVMVNTVTLDITDTALRVIDADGSTVLHSLPRTYQVSVQSGLAGVTLLSSGTATGSALPFNLTDEIVAPMVGEVTGTIRVESSFGNVTDYATSVGEALTSGSLSGQVDVQLVTGDAATIPVSDSFTGGVGDLDYAVTNGTLPPGLSLTGAGVIQGTPIQDGSFDATIKVEDLTGNQIFLEYLFTIQPSANVHFNPPPANEDIPYSYNPNISGVTAALQTTGTLPVGITLNSVTGALSGTPTASGTYTFGIQFTVNGQTELVESTIVVYEQMQAEVIKNGASDGFAAMDGSKDATLTDQIQIQVTGGSGNFQYAISGSNLISSTGTVQLFEVGEATVTVTDVTTGQIVTFSFLVAGQPSICGLAIETEASDESSNAPCVDIITDCNTPINVAFETFHLLKGVGAGETPYREYPNFSSNGNSSITNDGKAFVMFLATAPNGWAVANNAKDGKPFIAEWAVNTTQADGTQDVAIGITRQFDPDDGLAGLEFAAVITTVGGNRVVEIRKNNAYQAGSRFAIAHGDQIGFMVTGDSVHLYLNGLLKYTLTGATFACSGMDLVVYAEQMNTIVGGQATNIVYAIDTAGTADQVGTINPQTGVYTPSLNNVGYVRITGTNLTNDQAVYFANIRVIKPALKQSFERAMIEGRAVDMWVANLNRFDDLPLRLDRNGHPDRNQLDNPIHLGTLQGSGRIEETLTRNEFRNDRGSTSTSLTIDKVMVTGAVLVVRDFEVVRRIIPYMREKNSHGVRQLKQFSTGCPSKMRVILVWQSPDCDDVPVYDAIEVVNGTSYTPFNIEIGQAVQTNIPLSIEGFPNSDGLIFDYNQYDKAFHRISA